MLLFLIACKSVVPREAGTITVESQEITPLVSTTPIPTASSITATRLVTPTQANSTKIPTAELTSLPTTRPAPETSAFSLSTANYDIPADIIEEVFFQGGGGGGDCDAALGEPVYHWPSHPHYAEPKDRVLLCVEGWEASQPPIIEIVYPDGSSETVSADLKERQSGPRLVLSFHVGLDDPVGNYNFVFEYNGAAIERAFYVVRPVAPRLYVELNEENVPTGRVDLFNFLPNERVRLFAYNFSSGHLLGWQGYITDQEGYLRLDVESDRSFYFVAVGSRSGQAAGFHVNPSLGLLEIPAPDVVREGMRHGVRIYEAHWAGGSRDWWIDERDDSPISHVSYASCEVIAKTGAWIEPEMELYLLDFWGTPLPDMQSYRVIAPHLSDGWAFRIDDVWQQCPQIEEPMAANRGNSELSLTATPTTMPPEQTIILYYGYLNKQQYEAAWSMLSPNFRQSNHDDNLQHYISGYTEMEMCSVDVEQTAVLVPSEDKPVVTATLMFHLGESCAATRVEIDFQLIPAPSGGSWLIDRASLSN